MNTNQEITSRFLNDFNGQMFLPISESIVGVEYEPESLTSENEALELVGETLKELVIQTLESHYLFVDDIETEYFFNSEESMDYSEPSLQFIVKSGEYKIVVEYVFLHSVHAEGFSKSWMEFSHYFILDRTQPY